MSTFRTFDKVETHATFCRTAAGDVWLNYPEPMNLNNKAKHLVDDHNHRIHYSIDLVEVKKNRWTKWHFSFFLAISEVNMTDGPA